MSFLGIIALWLGLSMLASILYGGLHLLGRRATERRRRALRDEERARVAQGSATGRPAALPPGPVIHRRHPLRAIGGVPREDR